MKKSEIKQLIKSSESSTIRVDKFMLPTSNDILLFKIVVGAAGQMAATSLYLSNRKLIDGEEGQLKRRLVL